jgi:tetrahydromethanopterin S-methyltransferase subunit G
MHIRDMAEQSDVLDFLRVNFTRVHERFDRIETRLGEVVQRLSGVERDLAAMKVDYAATQLRLDNMDRASNVSNAVSN